MIDYDASYFVRRQPDELKRQVMRRQELERLSARVRLTAGTVVDIGCGRGEFLDLLPAPAWMKFGIEVAESARTVCIRKGIRFDLPRGGGWCDLVLLRGSLQHLDQPIDMLSRAYEWLRPGGRLAVLATPNAGGPVYRLFQDLPALDPPRNFIVFSDRVLRQCLLNIGFREPHFSYPYLGTPYASPLRDHLRFLLRLCGVRRPFAFWRNMMECYARK